jgi:hypothetical protein
MVVQQTLFGGNNMNNTAKFIPPAAPATTTTAAPVVFNPAANQNTMNNVSNNGPLSTLSSPVAAPQLQQQQQQQQQQQPIQQQQSVAAPALQQPMQQQSTLPVAPAQSSVSTAPVSNIPGQSVESQALGGGSNASQISNFLSALQQVGAGGNNTFQNGGLNQQQPVQNLINPNGIQNNASTATLNQGGQVYNSGIQNVANGSSTQGNTQNLGGYGVSTNPISSQTNPITGNPIPPEHTGINVAATNAAAAAGTATANNVVQNGGSIVAQQQGNPATGSPISPTRTGQTNAGIVANQTPQNPNSPVVNGNQYNGQSIPPVQQNIQQQPNLAGGVGVKQFQNPGNGVAGVNSQPTNNNGSLQFGQQNTNPINPQRTGQTLASDENLKTNISPATRGINDFLAAIHAHTYNYKHPELDGAGTYTSPMAQELEKTEIGKSAVINTPRGKMVDYGRLSGVNLAASSVLYREQQRLQNQVQALTKQFKTQISKGK